ncbi:glycosyltransferase [Paucihalobacter ruber]|uniref:glycosyltransferase n=1 Tax=Paucihalobacter ruber TaxID=2567861 RepID=UPI001C1EA59D|nr:glycosyltransferase [Paucihalobacter ruber]
MTYKHYIITRFNLRKSDWNTGKKNISVLTDQWHDNRFELFANFCFPFVAAQTNKNFE